MVPSSRSDEGVKLIARSLPLAPGSASIRSQVAIADQLKSQTLGTEITTTAQIYEATSAEAAQVTALLSHDDRSVSELRKKVEHDLADVAKATTLIEGYKNPQAKGAAAKAVANFPFESVTTG